MRLVYVDEAGLASRKQEPWLTVCAVIVDGDRQLQAVENHLERLVTRYIPARHRDNFVFHATHLFNGGDSVFKRLDADEYGPPEFPLERRLAIADELANIPRKHGLTITYGMVERASWPQGPELRERIASMSARERAIGEHVTAFMACALEVEYWMRENAPNEICLLIVEDNQQARQLILENQIANQKGSLLGELTEREKRHLPLRKIKEEPAFQKKRRGSTLQVADFCAYVGKRVQMGDERYHRFVRPFVSQIYEWGGKP